MKYYLRKMVISFSILLLAGCSSSMSSKSESAIDIQKNSHLDSAFDDFETQLTELDSEFIRQGKTISPEYISQVVEGKSRTEVQGLLGEPHTKRGADKQWWFYNINLPMGLGSSLVCQYRVGFTKGQGTSDTTWRRPQCQNRYTALLEKKSSKFKTQELMLSSEVLFSYNSAELTLAGKRELDKLVNTFFSHTQQLRVTVLGHTDRIGSETYNLALSQRRADAVDAYITSQESTLTKIMTGGRGSREPLVFCKGKAVTQTLKDCLAPNRRVQIIIEGLQD